MNPRMISTASSGQQPAGPGDRRARPRHWPSPRIVVLAVLSAHTLGCAGRVVEAGPETAEGEAVLAALEHVAEIMWEPEPEILVAGTAAIAHDGERPLTPYTRGFLNTAFEARSWRWSTEDPLTTENCRFPRDHCQLKDPTELHLTFAVWPWPGEADFAGEPSSRSVNEFVVEPVAGREGYKVHVEWLVSLRLREGGHRAVLGGEELLVTLESEGWVVDVIGSWIT